MFDTSTLHKLLNFLKKRESLGMRLIKPMVNACCLWGFAKGERRGAGPKLCTE